MNRQDLFVGVDIGGTSVAVLVVDEQDRVRACGVTPTDGSSLPATLAGVEAAIRGGLERAGAGPAQVAAVGLGVPGYVDPRTGGVELAVNPKWQAVAAGALLAQSLGVPCSLENRVRLAALGLQRHPRYTTVRNLAYLSVGTSIAAGLILEGRLYTGARGRAGEIGHLMVDPGGPPCACGAQGCLEAVAAGPALLQRTHQAIEAGAATRLADQQPLTVEAVYAAAQAGDPVALDITLDAAHYLAQAIRQLVLAYDVECVVLGGGLIGAGAAFFEPLFTEITGLREQSPRTRLALQPEMIHVRPADYHAGAWGAITLAAEHARPRRELVAVG
jgi:glucokinase